VSVFSHDHHEKLSEDACEALANVRDFIISITQGEPLFGKSFKFQEVLSDAVGTLLGLMVEMVLDQRQFLADLTQVVLRSHDG